MRLTKHCQKIFSSGSPRNTQLENIFIRLTKVYTARKYFHQAHQGLHCQKIFHQAHQGPHCQKISLSGSPRSTLLENIFIRLTKHCYKIPLSGSPRYTLLENIIIRLTKVHTARKIKYKDNDDELMEIANELQLFVNQRLLVQQLHNDNFYLFIINQKKRFFFA